VASTGLRDAGQFVAPPIANLDGHANHAPDIGRVELGLLEDYIRTASGN
jgi:hypothetical protein